MKYFHLHVNFFLLTLILCLGCFTHSFAQADRSEGSESPPSAVEWDANNPYYKIMAENVIKLDTVIEAEALNQLIATLERVARVEQDKALPQYYIGYAYAMKSFREKDLDNIDKWCDQSEVALARAEQIGGIAEEEILVIRALVQYGRIQVDFMGRGMEASAQAERYLRKALKLNPENSRVLGMLGQHYLRMPAQAGGNREKSCHFITLAVEAYAKEIAGFPAGVFPIVPHWGEYDVTYLADKFCVQKVSEPKTKKR